MQTYRVMVDPQGLEYKVPNDKILGVLKDPTNKLSFKSKTVYFQSTVDPNDGKHFSSENIKEIVSLLSSGKWVFGTSDLRKERDRENKKVKQQFQREQFEKMQLNLFNQPPQGEPPMALTEQPKVAEQPKVVEQPKVAEQPKGQDNISLMLIKTLLSGAGAKIENLKLEVNGETIEFSCNIKN